MSPLTKAFVVLVTLLSILLVALVVPFVAQTDNLKDQISQLESRVAVANAAAASADAQKTLLVNQQSTGNAELEAAVKDLRGENLRLSQDLATAEADRAKANNELSKSSATSALMVESTKRLTDLLADRTTALGAAQTELVTIKTQNAQLVQGNNELDAQVNSLTASNRLLQERLADAGSAPKAGAAGYTGAGSNAASAGGNAVRGSVSAVDETNGIVLVQFNVGSNDGVRNNTKVLIYRGTEYLGTASVVKVDGNVSVGRVTQAKGAIQAGDAILSGVSL